MGHKTGSDRFLLFGLLPGQKKKEKKRQKVPHCVHPGGLKDCRECVHCGTYMDDSQDKRLEPQVRGGGLVWGRRTVVLIGRKFLQIASTHIWMHHDEGQSFLPPEAS